MNDSIVVFVRRRASETKHERRTGMIFTVDPPLLNTWYSYIRVDLVTTGIRPITKYWISNAILSLTL